MRACCWFMVIAVFCGSASAVDSEADLRALQQQANEKARAEEQALADTSINAYLRLGTWTLENVVRRRASLDLTVVAEVLERYDLVALHGLSHFSDLESILRTLRSTTGRNFKALTPSTRQPAPAIFFDADLVGYMKHRVFDAPPGPTHDPIIVAEMTWNQRPFYFGATQVYRNALAKSSKVGVDTRNSLLELFERFTRQMPPMFFALSTSSDPNPEGMTWLHGHVAPILKTGSGTLVGRSLRPDNVLTNYRRPVRTGGYPYHKALILSEHEASNRASPRLPIIVLTNLAD